MPRKSKWLLILFCLGACTQVQTVKTFKAKEAEHEQMAQLSLESLKVVIKQQAQGPSGGAKILQAALEMLDEKKIVIGSCYDYVKAVYERAGFKPAKCEIIYKKSELGPYADFSLLRSGDWVMYRNLPYNEIGHSAIFVEWIDFYKRSALTIEYAGMNRNEPGRIREADLSKVYQIIRAK